MNWEDFKENISDKFYNFRLFFRVRYEGLLQLKAWIPFIWSNRDWDYSYLLKIMEFKIKRMRKLFSECTWHCSSHKKSIKHMIVAEELLKRLYEDDYGICEYKNSAKCSCPTETWKLVDLEPSDKLYGKAKRMVFLHCDYCNANRPRWYEQMEAKKEADTAYLFDLLKKAHKKWWC